jgi:hypothetical protein
MRNFVRLTGVIKLIETHIENGVETDWLLLEFAAGQSIWSRIDLADKTVWKKLRSSWVVGNQVIVLGALAASGQIYINARGVYTPLAFELDQQRRNQRRNRVQAIDTEIARTDPTKTAVVCTGVRAG